MLRLSLRKAARAIIFTESSKCDLVRWTGVSPAKVRVVPHGLSQDIWDLAGVAQDAPERQIGPQLSGGRPYVLYVSATYGYKNHARLIRAFGIMKRRTGLPHALLLVGSEVSVSFAELREVARQAGVYEDVILTGRLERHGAVAATYLSADVTVVPTLYETFGFPVLEAMACGSPVVTSEIGSMAELAGDAAVLVNPLDEEAIAQGIERVLRDPDLRRQMVERGRRRAAEYTWQRSAAQTLEILEAVGQRT
jgi:glycosyltransferase involved in cell wall biosynthesis